MTREGTGNFLGKEKSPLIFTSVLVIHEIYTCQNLLLSIFIAYAFPCMLPISQNIKIDV